MSEEKITPQKLVWWVMTVAVGALAAIAWFWIQSVESRNAGLTNEVRELRQKLDSKESGGKLPTHAVGPNAPLVNPPNAPFKNPIAVPGNAAGANPED